MTNEIPIEPIMLQVICPLIQLAGASVKASGAGQEAPSLGTSDDGLFGETNTRRRRLLRPFLSGKAKRGPAITEPSDRQNGD